MGSEMNAASIEDDTSRRSIKVWMREVMQTKGWTANEWARKAGTSPTNITRFLAPTSTIIPSSSTISKLSRVAGSQPRMGIHNLNTAPACNVPLLIPQLVVGFSSKELWEFVMSSAAQARLIAVDGTIEGPSFVVDVPAFGMTGRGIHPGDRILVEKVKPADLEAGHIVLFKHQDQAMIGEWQGGMIVFYPALPSPEFMPVRSSMVDVYGRVRRLIREL